MGDLAKKIFLDLGHNFDTTMMKAFALVLALIPVAFGQNDGPDRSICGDPTDLCMNDESWESCRKLEEQGCEEIIAEMESCPLQFSCGDEHPHPHPGPHPKPHPNPPRPHPRPKPYIKPDACVSLFVYKDKRCSGKPLHELTFPTWSKPGSPCYHDALMDNISVRSQYCNMKTGNLHEQVFVGSDNCSTDWWNRWWSPMDLTFTSDSCIGGLSLHYCKHGPCKEEDGEDDFDSKEDEMMSVEKEA